MAKIKVENLREAIRYNRKQLQPFRTSRVEMLKEFVGKNYSDQGAEDRIPVNLLEQAISIYARSLVASRPKAVISTPHDDYKAPASDLELAINHVLKQVDIKRTLQLAVLDAMFNQGVVKVALNQSASIDFGGIRHLTGQPKAEVIDFDNWVHDTTAYRWEQIQFCGDRFFASKEQLIESGLFESRHINKLPDKKFTTINTDGDERPIGLTASGGTEGSSLFEDVELWNIWIPRTRESITLHPTSGPILRKVKIDGPVLGPYRRLGFGDVPGNVMPLAPAALWFDLHDLFNRLFLKTGRKAERKKTVTGYRGGSEEDARRVRDSSDGDMVKMENPDNVREFTFGGMSQEDLLFLTMLQNFFTWNAGNLDTLGGLGAVADTLGQEKLVDQNSSKRVEEMQGRVADFTQGIMEDIGYYLFTDPFIQIPLVKRIPGYESVEIPFTFDDESRVGSYTDYNMELKPYSLQEQTPAMRNAMIDNVVGTLFVPLGPVMEQQGMTPNMEEILRQKAKNANMPELEDLVIFTGIPTTERQGSVGPPPTQHKQGGEGAGAGASHPIATRGAQNAATMVALSGQGQQPSQAANIYNPTG